MIALKTRKAKQMLLGIIIIKFLGNQRDSTFCGYFVEEVAWVYSFIRKTNPSLNVVVSYVIRRNNSIELGHLLFRNY